MNRGRIIIFAVAMMMSGGKIAAAQTGGEGSAPGGRERFARFSPPPCSRVVMADDFWEPRRQQVRSVTLPSQWEMLEAYHHIDNFRRAAGEEKGVHQGLVFFDSDLYKWLEAAGYVLARSPAPEGLSARVEELIRLIEAAQMPDGYLNTFYQSFAPEQRWQILFINHELYCAGHFLEAACAHYEARRDARLLSVARRLADHIAAEFGPGRNEGVPGHEEIELALIRLYRTTGERKYLDLASFFLYQRGTSRHFRRELLEDVRAAGRLERLAHQKRRQLMPEEKRGEISFGTVFDPGSALRSLISFASGKYFQVHAPLTEQTVAEGHAVRAMYLYTGAADLCLENGDERLGAALSAIWDNTISRRTYITGGMGSVAVVEGFGKDYELPNKSYAETCAAIGSFFFSWRMLRLEGKAQYADQMERTLYNAILSGLGLDGRSYFYQNPLTAHGERERKEWFTVACCPPNLARLLSSLERYLYGESAEGVWVHQYISGEARFALPGGEVRLAVESGLPWSGKVRLHLQLEKPLTFALWLRVPGWAEKSAATLNGTPLREALLPSTYLELRREWHNGEVMELDFDMLPRLIPSPPQVRENRGKVAIRRGPLVYCLEDVDNPGVNVHAVVIDGKKELKVEHRPNLLAGVDVIIASTADGRTVTAIPYYAWANRGRSHMEVWLRQR